MYGRILVLAASLSVVSGYAQQMLRVDVPFDFKANEQHWRAGAYEISFPRASVLQIRNLHEKRSGMVMTVPAQSSVHVDRAKLVFNRYGDSFFLSQVWPSDSGSALFRTNAERELAARFVGVATTAYVKDPKK
jgi:hypothetical protein